MLTAEWFIASYKPELQHYKTIWVAYSGGMDSHVLLDLARGLGLNVRAVHINHGLDKFDQHFQEHCQKICTALDIPLDCVTVNTIAKNGIGLEEAARNARRQAWQQLLDPQDVLLVAHHAQDQAETVLFRLLRGTGPSGLAGIKARSRVGGVPLLRPLLSISKDDIIAYAQQHNLNYCVDTSNNDNKFDRNYLRNTVLPKLTKRWPAAVASINRAADLCKQQEHLLRPQINTSLTAMQDANLALDLLDFCKLAPEWQHAILRAWLQQFSLVPSQKQLQLIMQQVINARNDATPEYILGDKIITRAKHKLYVLEAKQCDTAIYEISWDLQQELLLPNGRSINVASLAANQAFITKLAATTVTVRLGGHGRKAKKVFQQYAIPPWQRGEYPLIFADARLVAIVGLWNSQRF